MPDFTPPKPLGARAIAKLGARCDRLERMASLALIGDLGTYDLSPDTMPFEDWTGILDRWNEAKIAYGRAIRARDLYIITKARNSTRRVKSGDKFPLEDAMYAARDRLELIEALRPEFETERALVDANAAADTAEELLDIAKNKFIEAEREARADKRAGIVRYPASRIYRRDLRGPNHV
jgi:hypothetical protein